tara:strand:- start:1309 stop:1785 length:477 start_codon:yes stop_codon:yes gene_type:complete
MGIRIPQIPDELLETVRQYIGNCRIYNNELIMTLDKKSEEFMNISHFIKKRWKYKISYKQFYHETYEESLTEEKKTNWNKWYFQSIRGLMQYIGTVPKDRNWVTQSIWRMDKHNNRYRFIVYRYYADTNTLLFHYKNKATQSKKDPFKKNLEVLYVIP